MTCHKNRVSLFREGLRGSASASGTPRQSLRPVLDARERGARFRLLLAQLGIAGEDLKSGAQLDPRTFEVLAIDQALSEVHANLGGQGVVLATRIDRSLRHAPQ